MVWRPILFGWCCALIFALGSCASSGPPNSEGRGTTTMAFGSEPESIWDQSRANPAAFDAFTFRKMQPIGSKNDFQFYYKTCEDVSAKTWYSKTSYECTVP